jgi:hypothetical protein
MSARSVWWWGNEGELLFIVVLLVEQYVSAMLEVSRQTAEEARLYLHWWLGRLCACSLHQIYLAVSSTEVEAWGHLVVIK